MFKSIKQQLRSARVRRQDLLDLDVAAAMPGGERGGWPLIPCLVTADSVVYSFGVGDNIIWDLAMIEQAGVEVHAFDPTPESIQWVAGQSTPAAFHFHPYGLSNVDGAIEFFPPKKPGRMHFSQDRQKYTRADHQKVSCPVHRLSTVMDKLGHARVDVLKMDIEGSEFDAVPDLLDARIPVGQLLVEIHWNSPARSFAQGMRLIRRIKDAGMSCFYVSPRGLEFGFVSQQLVAGAAA